MHNRSICTQYRLHVVHDVWRWSLRAGKWCDELCALLEFNYYYYYYYDYYDDEYQRQSHHHCPDCGGGDDYCDPHQPPDPPRRPARFDNRRCEINRRSVRVGVYCHIPLRVCLLHHANTPVAHIKDKRGGQ